MIRIVVVEDAIDGQPREPRWQFLDTSADDTTVAELERPRPILMVADDDSPSLTFLVEWFQALAGAEWQWT